MPQHPLAADLAQILAATRELWEALRGERILITGGTGFFGRWLLESFVWANDQLALDAHAVVLTRDPNPARVPAHPSITLLQGDVCSFTPPAGSFNYMIHAATDARATLNSQDPLAMLDTIIDGTRHVLDFARQAGVRRALLTSSGLVYGPQPPELSHVPEDYPGGGDPTRPNAAYAEGKRIAELLFANAHRHWGLEATIARCYAFVGPYLPLDEHFAIGNFVRDTLNGGPVRIGGDGTPVRSYMYPTDLVIWLWTILLRGQPGRPYNVGAEDAAPLSQVAREVAGDLEVTLAHPPGSQPPNRYVPSTRRAREELGLKITVERDEAIRRTLAWHRSMQP
jgi:dTDP-glucose 4,6-dehydratase